jgi:phosphoribosylaminoimidazolecarboxamide formyltransferase/IMP cyclohydrolase
MAFKESILESRQLRYGENPHQKGYFFGDLEKCLSNSMAKN